MTDFDLIVIGSGPGGYTTAARAAASGLRVMLCERDELGGTCLNRGCIPTKALCHTSSLAAAAREAAAAGVNIGREISVDLAAAMDRKDSIVAELRQGVAMELKDVTVIKGEASFLAADTVEIDGTQYKAPRMVVATGSRPAMLDIPGAELAVNSDFMLSCRELPESITIIGGGVIGIEFASILADCGAKVTVIEYCQEILPPFDAEVAKRLRMCLKRRGIKIITGAAVKSIEEGMKVTYESKGRLSSVESSMVLMAVGRRPVLPAGLEQLGIELHRGFIKVDPLTMESSLKGVYAIGDVNGLCLLAHAAEAQGAALLGHKINLGVIPSAVFCRPECAMAGLTEEQARSREIDIMVGQSTFRSNGKAIAMGEPDGMVKVIAERSSGKLLGCHICGAHAADLIAEPALAIAHGLTAADLLATVHTHPTLGEVIPRALSALT